MPHRLRVRTELIESTGFANNSDTKAELPRAQGRGRETLSRNLAFRGISASAAASPQHPTHPLRQAGKGESVP
jgi:hypothetical protein